ncbi:unnamed protein product [Amoebophrya sp. A25]|nr:unnamed protein product [Amoebophrya sp. A25]|eukprot:GSA25T00017920001.1
MRPMGVKMERLGRLPPPLDRLPRASRSPQLLSPHRQLRHDQQEGHDLQEQEQSLVHFIYPYDLSGAGTQAAQLVPFICIRRAILGERASRYVTDSAIVGTSMCFDGLKRYPPPVCAQHDFSSSSSGDSGRTTRRNKPQEQHASQGLRAEKQEARQQSAATKQKWHLLHYFVPGVRKEPQCAVIATQWRPFAHMLNTAINIAQFLDRHTEGAGREVWEQEKSKPYVLRGGINELKRQVLSGVDEVAVVPYKVRRSPRSSN